MEGTKKIKLLLATPPNYRDPNDKLCFIDPLLKGIQNYLDDYVSKLTYVTALDEYMALEEGERLGFDAVCVMGL